MTRLQVTRRSFLKGMIYIGTCIGGTKFLAGLLSIRQVTPRELGQELVATLRPRKSAAWIGRRYLASFPTEADVSFLVRSIVGGQVRASGRISGFKISSLNRTLAAKQRAEYASELVIELDGWVLSRSEARLYALAALV